MVSETPVQLDEDANAMVDTLVSRSSPGKKKPGKVPRRVHKAEREKLKRDNMNVLFLDLAKTLEPSHQNKGKSSTLSDSVSLLRELLAQIDCLKKENATLLSEFQYVTVEKNELEEEKFALDNQVEKLQTEIQNKNSSNSLWRINPSQLQNTTTVTQPLGDHLETQATSIVGPVFVVPLHNDAQVFPEPADTISKLKPNVSRPHARYPSSSDLWPTHILSEQPKADQNFQNNSSSSSSTSSGEEY